MAPSRGSRPAPLRLRLVTMADGPVLLAWRNDPETRRQSFVQDRVRLRTHLAWLAGKLADPTCWLFLAVDQRDRPVGQVRLERLSRGVAEVHISVAPEARGRGVARATLALAAGASSGTMAVRTLVAHVRPDNVASVIAFVKAGFEFQRRTKVKGTACYRLEKRI